MEITEKLKQRFCKDCNIPINIFREPYFTDRIQSFNKQYNTVFEYEIFKQTIRDFKSEQEYFEYYGSVKDSAINYIKNSDGFKRFNEMDMSEISKKVAQYKFPSSDIYKPSFDGQSFISIDMKQANFTSLNLYDPGIFNHAKSWAYFMCEFTDYMHIIRSKYIRQVIFGNCNPKRHITYEKYLMCSLLPFILAVIPEEDIVCFTNDEIVIRIDRDKQDGTKLIEQFSNEFPTNIPVKFEDFTLRQLNGGIGYVKLFDDGSYKLKCVDNDFMPMVVSMMNYGIVRKNDLYFMHKNILAKFTSLPKFIEQCQLFDDFI